MMRFSQARQKVLDIVRQACRQPSSALVPLEAAAGRVLAEAVSADRDYPPFDRATRDGYALRAADLSGGAAELALIGEARAGALFDRAVGPGQCVSIMTGAPVPFGADAVVMLEHSRRDEAAGRVRIERKVKPGDNLVKRGAEAAAGSILLPAGQRLGHAEVALLASAGRVSVPVVRRPRVAILPTGDEVVEVDQPPLPHQIRNSNSYSLRVQVAAAGGVPYPIGIAPDEPHRLRQLINQGLGADLLLLSGGVSLGKYDLVEQVLAELGAEFYFDAVAIQPGRPLVFGRARGTFFFGLPGNPLSTMVSFDLFARPALELLAGMSPPPLLFLRARLEKRVRHKPGLTRFLPAVLSPARDNPEALGAFEPVVRLAEWQGSGDIVALTRANCYLVLPEDREELAEGEMAAVLLRS